MAKKKKDVEQGPYTVERVWSCGAEYDVLDRFGKVVYSSCYEKLAWDRMKSLNEAMKREG